MSKSKLLHPEPAHAATTSGDPEWVEAAADAEVKISRLEAKIRGLRASVQTFRHNFETGIPWPSKGGPTS
jgi:hypothetical protein